MEKLKVKHDHTLTDIIKVGVFALFLILPILVFLPNCLYYGFNEHATNETTTEIIYKYQSNEVNTIDDLVEGNIYHFNIENTTLDNYVNINTGMELYLQFINLDEYDFEHYNINFEELIASTYENNGFFSLTLEIYDTSTNFCIYFVSNENNDYFVKFETTSLSDDDFTLKGDFIYAGGNLFELTDNTLITQTDYNIIESVETNVENTITQSVTNAWQRMWETPMLQWTDNNTFKFTINAFVNVFGITPESKMANYLTYLLVITSIYLVFDIVLTLTTKLTHLINAK